MIAIPALPDSPAEDVPTPSSNAEAGTGQPTAEPNAFSANASSRTAQNFGKAPLSKATTPRTRDIRLPSGKTGSVFDRLYKTQTAASKAWSPARNEARRGGTYSTPTPSSSNGQRTPPSGRSNASSVDDSTEIFQRLHITGTVANASKRVTPKHSVHLNNSRSMRSPSKSIPSTHTPLKGGKKPKVGYVYSPRMKPVTTLYFDSKYHPGIGKETVDPIKLGYSFFQMFCEYENGGLTTEQIAREIIIAFFKKDFPFGR